MTDIEALIGQVRRPERVVRVCLRGDLLAEWDDLSRQLAEATGQAPTSLADGSAARELAERVEALSAEIRASEHPFRLRGLSDRQLSDLTAAHPPRQGRDELWDPTTFGPALLSACAVDPAMTPDQAARLFDDLSRGDTSRLFTAAWEACTRAVDVPFSATASALLRPIGER